jgi:sulfur carrier protein
MAISIRLNGETRELSGEITLDRLLEEFSLPKQRIAIELNQKVVRRTDWPQTIVSDGDRLEVVHFVGGG